MSLTLSAAEWLGLAGSLLGSLFALLFLMGRVLLRQVEQRLDARFVILDQQRQDGQRAWKTTFDEHLRREEREFETTRDMQNTLHSLAYDLATNYVRRDELRDQLAELRATSRLLDEKMDRVLLAVGGIHGTH